MSNENLENLHGWYITYNYISNVWLATTSEYRANLANNMFSINVLRAKDFPTLQAILIQHGDKNPKDINQIYEQKTKANG